MSKRYTLLYYTNNLTPKRLLQKTLKDVLDVAASRKDLELIVCSQFAISEFPQKKSLASVELEWEDIDRFVVSERLFNEKDQPFPIKTFVVGKMPRLLKSLTEQLIFCLQQVETEAVIFAEDDILYPPEYFERVIAALDDSPPIVYAEPFILFNTHGFYDADGEFYLSRYAGRTDLFLDHFKKELIQPRNFEPILKGKISSSSYDGVQMYEDFVVVTLENPVLDIKHGLNIVGVPLHPNTRDEDPFWGNKKDIVTLIEDPLLTHYLNSNRKALAGLDAMTRTNGNPTAVDLARVFRNFGHQFMQNVQSAPAEVHNEVVKRPWDFV